MSLCKFFVWRFDCCFVCFWFCFFCSFCFACLVEFFASFVCDGLLDCVLVLRQHYFLRPITQMMDELQLNAQVSLPTDDEFTPLTIKTSSKNTSAVELLLCLDGLLYVISGILAGGIPGFRIVLCCFTLGGMTMCLFRLRFSLLSCFLPHQYLS